MTEILESTWRDRNFWLLLAFDWMLVYSLVFSIVYSLYILVLSLPFRQIARPRPLVVPVIFLLSGAVMFTPVKDVLTSCFGGAFTIVSSWITARTGFRGAGYALMLAWLVGAAFYGIKLAWRLASLRRFLSTLPPAWEDGALTRACATAGRRKGVDVRIADSGFPPSSWTGEYVVVPWDYVDRFDTEERFIVYLHELACLAERNSRKYVAAALVRCVFWFHPVVRLALERFKTYLEIACDHRVLTRYGIAPVEYGQMLVKTVRRGKTLAPGLSGGFRDLGWRLGVVFGDRTLLPGRKRRGLAAALLLAALLVFLGYFQGRIGEDPFAAGKGDARFRWQGILGLHTIR